jgi:hypothetical protein
MLETMGYWDTLLWIARRLGTSKGYEALFSKPVATLLLTIGGRTRQPCTR